MLKVSSMESMKKAHQVLSEIYGFSQFRPNQEEIIQVLVGGQHAFVLMPTGGGKSLCYQIPSIVRNGVGLVVSPLIALMEDQVLSLKQAGVKAEFLNSSLDLGEAQQIENQLRAGELDLVYVSPERLMTPRFLGLIKSVELALIAIDESHCISQWGHDFRPEYGQLSEFYQMFPEVPRVALTATADGPTREEIVSKLGLGGARRFISSFDRPNIQYRVELKNNAKKQLLNFIQKEHSGEAGIVYCLSRKKTEDVADFLVENGLNAHAYHAGLSNAHRRRVQKKFLRDEGLIVVATIAFGMGIDKSNVRFVAHVDLPKSIEGYYQETGRAGRDGLPSTAWMVYGLSEVVTHRQLLEKSEAGENHKRISTQKLSAMLGYSETTQCRRQVLLDYFKENLPEPCNNCDTCVDPVESWDGTVVVQKALSCVYRSGQRFGVQYLIGVLLGQSNERIYQFGHDRLSTYGIGKELTNKQWNSVFRQLIAGGYVRVDVQGFGGLSLSEKARPILRGEEKIHLRKDLEEKRSKGNSKKAGKAKYEKGSLENSKDQKLFDKLREHRTSLAREQKIPPYLIFHDSALYEMVHLKPQSEEDMMLVQGVGSKKFEKYGQSFIECINTNSIK